ncbi:penicillin-binding protein 2 [Acidithiobacillus sp.]|uniref:penicillin-binding protein 2 n=1 Tax=Acidithiobacillus sp. TaxID=1872118 RepID=UPI002588B8A8|nr:penicillin-binding protein 2 [Acidithiobacillus sp.]MDD5374669.1 penicillin-binding protein 2 [Acidithiobacillus sp.]
MNAVQPTREHRQFTRRLLGAAGLITVLTALLAIQIFRLQVWDHDLYATQSTHNTIVLLPIAPQRGLILDRHGQILADDQTGFALTITPNKTMHPEETIQRLRRILPVSAEDQQRFNRDLLHARPYQPILLRGNLSPGELAAFAVQRHQFPGVDIQTRIKRHYPYGSLFAHAVGYMGRLTPAEIREEQRADYAGLDSIGKSGLEVQYETLLKGQPGDQEVEVDARGHTLRTRLRNPPRRGVTIRTTLDLAVQQAAAKAMMGQQGAVVALDPRNGDVLAAYSAPAFDPNAFVDGLSTAAWSSLQDDPGMPMANRFLRGSYPPGSTIKPFVALSALHDKAVAPDQRLAGGAYYQIPGTKHKYYDWKPGGHGAQNLREAIRDSNDVYFYQIAMRLGAIQLGNGLAHFGFGQRSGVDLPGESAGVIPSPLWLRRHYGQTWYQGQTVMMGIGQGYLLSTPLQLARATASIANGGRLVIPHMKQSSGGATQPLDFSPEDIAVIQGAMRDAVTSGTGKSLANDLHAIAGKTGTAQVHHAQRNDSGRVLHDTIRLWQDHALFIAYAPADHPRIAVAVVVEHGGHGGSTAGPVARAVIDAYLNTLTTPEVNS